MGLILGFAILLGILVHCEGASQPRLEYGVFFAEEPPITLTSQTWIQIGNQKIGIQTPLMAKMQRTRVSLQSKTGNYLQSEQVKFRFGYQIRKYASNDYKYVGACNKLKRTALKIHSVALTFHG